MLLLDSVPNSWHPQCQCQKSLFANRIVKISLRRKRIFPFQQYEYKHYCHRQGSAGCWGIFTACGESRRRFHRRTPRRCRSCCCFGQTRFLCFEFLISFFSNSNSIGVGGAIDQTKIISTLRLEKFLYYICQSIIPPPVFPVFLSMEENLRRAFPKK